MATATGTVAEPVKVPAKTPFVTRIISSDSIPAGGFTPGTILADRYRIIGLLGRGGMGEVYRADDLKLGQPVALKFLPPKLAEDPVRRERFFAEVRITRQLSHPNICRVYDIGEIDGRHFLSMEFIDGEDLASLLRRIGHLSNEKALDIARQLAAGLAAAHERGVLHRDLKPANIMLDGHGRVRITDFGLAIAQGDETQAAEIAGTPAYMAPEQLAGKGATVRSDIYSLGLVLYEIYTGKKAFTAMTLAELREQKETHTPRAISELREGMDPVVERLIRRCMERDPNARPSSVAQLALALPGGDPIAAALAAGETPSPEMVAASGGKEGLRLSVAWGLLVIIILGTIALPAMGDRIFLHRRIPTIKSPTRLVERSHEILKRIGLLDESADFTYSFKNNLDYLKAGRRNSPDAKAILFLYRQSPNPIEDDTVPIQVSGEIMLSIDAEGHLVSLRAVPPVTPSFSGGPPIDLSTLLPEAGFEVSKCVIVTGAKVQSSPRFHFDTRTEWECPPSKSGDPVRIEATSLEGMPVSFEIINSPTEKQGSALSEIAVSSLGVTYPVAYLSLSLVLIGGALFFARRNLRLGRGDRRNANRLALIAFILGMSSWVIGTHHTGTQEEMNRFFIQVSKSLFTASVLWIYYMALEPFVRRRWPRILVSWTRLLAGEWRDPHVARDVFIACALGILWFDLLLFMRYFVPTWLGGGTSPLQREQLNYVLDVRIFLSRLIDMPINIIFVTLMLFFLLFIARALLRNQKAATAACIILLAFLLMAMTGSSWIFIFPFLGLSAFWFFILMRFGFLVEVLAGCAGALLLNFVTTLDSSAWYFKYGLAALAIFAVVVFYAFRTSLGGRPLLAASHLDD